MFRIFINGLFILIKRLTNLFLFPINAIVYSVFPDFTSYVNNFTSWVNSYVGNGFGFFSYLLPPNARALITFYLGLLVILYTTTFTVHLLIKTITIIKNIKIW